MLKKLHFYKSIIIGYSLILIGFILIILPFIIQFNEIAKYLIETIGTALIPSGLISLINDYALSKDFSKEVREQLDEFISTNLDTIIDKQINKAIVLESNPTLEISNIFASSQKK